MPQSHVHVRSAPEPGRLMLFHEVQLGDWCLFGPELLLKLKHSADTENALAVADARKVTVVGKQTVRLVDVDIAWHPHE